MHPGGEVDELVDVGNVGRAGGRGWDQRGAEDGRVIGREEGDLGRAGEGSEVEDGLGGAVVRGGGVEAEEGHHRAGGDGVGAPGWGASGVALGGVEEGFGTAGPADEEGGVGLAEAELQAVVEGCAGVEAFRGEVEGEVGGGGGVIPDDHGGGGGDADRVAAGEVIGRVDGPVEVGSGLAGHADGAGEDYGPAITVASGQAVGEGVHGVGEEAGAEGGEEHGQVCWADGLEKAHVRGWNEAGVHGHAVLGWHKVVCKICLDCNLLALELVEEKEGTYT